MCFYQIYRLSRPALIDYYVVLLIFRIVPDRLAHFTTFLATTLCKRIELYFQIRFIMVIIYGTVISNWYIDLRLDFYSSMQCLALIRDIYLLYLFYFYLTLLLFFSIVLALSEFIYSTAEHQISYRLSVLAFEYQISSSAV